MLEGGARFRVNVFTQSRGVGAVFRVIPAMIPTLDDLRLPSALKKLAQQANGLVLITGPTGSGKTTTLAAVVNEINRTSRRHVITVEDPNRVRAHAHPERRDAKAGRKAHGLVRRRAPLGATRVART